MKWPPTLFISATDNLCNVYGSSAVFLQGTPAHLASCETGKWHCPLLTDSPKSYISCPGCHNEKKFQLNPTPHISRTNVLSRKIPLPSWSMFCKNTNHSPKHTWRAQPTSIHFLSRKDLGSSPGFPYSHPLGSFHQMLKPRCKPRGKPSGIPWWSCCMVCLPFHTIFPNVYCKRTPPSMLLADPIQTITEWGSTEILSLLALFSWCCLCNVLIKTCGVHKSCRQNRRWESFSNNEHPPAPASPPCLLTNCHYVWTRGTEKGLTGQKSQCLAKSLPLRAVPCQRSTGEGSEPRLPSFQRSDLSGRQGWTVLGSFPLAAHKSWPSLVLCHLAP